MHITRDMCGIFSVVKIQSFILSFLVCKPRVQAEQYDVCTKPWADTQTHIFLATSWDIG